MKLPDGPRPVGVFPTAYGRMIVSPIEGIQYTWLEAVGISAENPEILNVREMLEARPRGVVVDVGASFGCWSMALAPLATRVLAFEPQRSVHNMLCGTVALNGLDHVVQPHCVALGRDAGLASMARLPTDLLGDSGGLALNAPSENRPDSPMDEVPVRRLGEFLRSGESVSFIKIDVEGNELDVLLGAPELVGLHRPIMFIEWARGDHVALRSYLEGADYVLEDRNGDNFICIPMSVS